jgi:hypothetical protein
MKTLLLATVALVAGAVVADAATLCAHKRRRPVVRAACRAGETRTDAAICTRKNGQLVLRAACRAGERAADTNDVVLAGRAGAPGAEGAAGAAARFPIRIVDALDQDIGEPEQFHPDSARVRIRRGPLTKPVVFSVLAGGFEPNTGGAASAAFYAGADCATVPHIVDDGLAVSWAQVFGNAAYVSEAPAGTSMTTASREFDSRGKPCPTGSTPTARGACCQNGNLAMSFLRPAIRIPLADLGLVPPFRAIRVE